MSNLAGKISVVGSAVEALEFLNTLKNNSEEFPDLIFLDINMPVMDGFGFLEEFSKFPVAVTGQCVVVMLTSSSDPKDENRAFQYPVVKRYLNKPLNRTMLDEVFK